MKTCKDCGKELPFSSFRKKPSNKDGYEIRCKECRNIRYNKADPRRVFAKIYNSQVANSVTRNHPAPDYTLDQLKDWVDSQPHAYNLWQNYVNSGYDNKLRPSVDRLDDSKPYRLNNIQLITWNENRQKGAASKMAGGISTIRPVSAFNKDGSLHKTYVSTLAAARDVNGHSWGIATVADGKPVKDGRGQLYNPKSYKGFIWKWV